MTQPSWPARLTALVAARVRHYRKYRGMSAQRLSDRCEELGLVLPRSTLADLENGRRASITLAELLVLAAALEVPPLELALPLGEQESTEILPDGEMPTWDAARWFCGDGTPKLPGAIGGPPGPLFVFTRIEDGRERELKIGGRDLPIDFFRLLSSIEGRHEIEAEHLMQFARIRARKDADPDLKDAADEAILTLQNFLADMETQMALVRSAMRERGLLPPPLPPSMMAAVDEREKQLRDSE
jgi:transcriptional regulator with XRE-family HTH domain